MTITRDKLDKAVTKAVKTMKAREKRRAMTITVELSIDELELIERWCYAADTDDGPRNLIDKIRAHRDELIETQTK